MSKYVVHTPIKGHVPGKTIQPGTADKPTVITIEDAAEADSLVACGAVTLLPEAPTEKPAKVNAPAPAPAPATTDAKAPATTDAKAPAKK